MIVKGKHSIKSLMVPVGVFEKVEENKVRLACKNSREVVFEADSKFEEVHL
jgi:hypothetical protein